MKKPSLPSDKLARPTVLANIAPGFKKPIMQQKPQEQETDEILSREDADAMRAVIKSTYQNFQNQQVAEEKLQEKFTQGIFAEKFAGFIGRMKIQFGIQTTASRGKAEVSKEDFQTFFPKLLGFLENPIQKLKSFAANVKDGLQQKLGAMRPRETVTAKSV